MTIVEVRVPEYRVDREPDYRSIGTRVDRAIEANFPDGEYLLRAIGVDDHPGLTLSELVRIVVTTGTDKHDPGRRSVGHDEFSGYDYDIQAGPIEIRQARLLPSRDEPLPTVFGGIVRHFYRDAPLDRGHAVRIDLLMLYDPRKMARARKLRLRGKSVRRGLRRFLYKFREPTAKREALRGLVQVLR